MKMQNLPFILLAGVTVAAAKESSPQNIRFTTGDQTIDSLDLRPIMTKLVSKGMDKQQAYKSSFKYKAFLFLKKKYADVTIAPGEEVDEFWHAHILDTEKYARDCEAIFGHFLHHYPYMGMKDAQERAELDDIYKQTLELYRIEFPGSDGEFIDRVALCIGEDWPKIKERVRPNEN